MRAFVLSGGGNRGPLQVGAIHALIERGILPDMIVGSSAGALNGAYLAIEPSLAQVQRMANLWRDAARRKLFAPSAVRAASKALRSEDHLVESKAIRAYIQASLPKGARTFGDLAVPLWVTICHLRTQTLYVYGDDPDGPLVDAVLTSAAVPGFFPPLHHGGEAFVDGGVMAVLPLKVAIARGATEIWAVDLAFEVDPHLRLKSALDIAGYTVKRPLYERVLHELEWAVRQPGVTVHHVSINAYPALPLGDWTKTEAMLEEGEHAARKYLAHPKPNQVHYPRHYGPRDLPPGPPGSRPFVHDVDGIHSSPRASAC